MADSKTMRVMKTLVIGLGSTGTRVCNALAERIRWELTDVFRAPWVRFLCIETDANESNDFRESGDFRSITISKEDYLDLLANPKPYDSSILFSQWADRETLEKLPDKAVSAGAGNIRMVGRLAFLWEENYSVIKAAVRERLNALRALADTEATERRGPLRDGTSPPVSFARTDENSDQLRVIVVGTLCGGTASGIAADFGYFLKTMCEPEERSIAILTLPPRDLTTATDAKAERYKRNAYHALVELNHYHLADRPDEAPIRFADGERPDTSVFPYDLVYLAVPRQTGKAGEQELRVAVADRVFLNAFVPETDGFSRAVDATIFDRDRRAHVFCSFGLASVEFPAFQVIEACAKRVLAHALAEWKERPLPAQEERVRLEEIGLTWPAILNSLGQQPGSEDIQTLLAKKRAEVVALACSDAAKARESLRELREAFFPSTTPGPLGSLAPGVVPRTFVLNRTNAADRVVANVRSQVRARLLDYYDGPAPLARVLEGARQRRMELNATKAEVNADLPASVDQILERLRTYQNSNVLRFAGLRDLAIRQIRPKLEEALHQEVKVRLDSAAYQVLQDQRDRGTVEPGVLTRIERGLGPIERRLRNLRTVVNALQNRLTERADVLSRSRPEVNGLCLFVPETTDGGTVPDEYRRCLRQVAGGLGEPWERGRERVAAEVIRAWDALPGAVAPEATLPSTQDWLAADPVIRPDRDPIPRADLAAMERAARQPFVSVANTNVLEKWHAEPNAVQQAQNAARESRPLLGIRKADAEMGERSGIHVRRVHLAPSGSRRDEFLNAVKEGVPGAAEITAAHSPDPFRAVLLEEWYRFPLSAVPTVLGDGGLHAARCTDFPTFHTRRDVQWTPLAQEEIDRLRRAEELVVLGVLLGILVPRSGGLVLKWRARRISEDSTEERKLELDVRKAARRLAHATHDVEGRPLQGADDLIAHRIEAIRRGVTDGALDAGASSEERDMAFLRRLQEELRKGTGGIVGGWDRDFADECVARFCAATPELYLVYQQLLPPDPALIGQLRRRAGEVRPRAGGVFDKDGLYCPECDGFIGVDERDAARHGWRCEVYPEHYYGYGVKAG